MRFWKNYFIYFPLHFFLALFLALPHPSLALEIKVVYDPKLGPPAEEDAVNPCAFIPPLPTCGQTDKLIQLMESAAKHYERIFKDDHTLTIRFFWLEPNSKFHDALIVERDGDGKPTKGRIRIWSGNTYYYDPFPDFDSEFLMRPKLFRTIPNVEVNEAFTVGTPNEVYEIAYNGREIDDAQREDLLTNILHEMAHILGLSNDVDTACDPNDNPPAYSVDSDFDGLDDLGIKALEFVDNGQTKFDCAHLALGGIVSCKTDPQKGVGEQFDEPSTVEGLTVGECASHQALEWQGFYPKSRSRPSINQILAMQRGGNWEVIDLPRIYSLTTGSWSDSDIWLGEQVPNNQDDVFIVNQLPLFEDTEVGVTGNQQAKSVYISDENTVIIDGSELDVKGPVTVAGPKSTTGPLRPLIDSNGEVPPIGIEVPVTTVEVKSAGILRAFFLTVENGAKLEIHDSGEANLGNMKNSGLVKGAGVINVFNLENSKKITANGGTLTFAIPEGDPGGTVVIGPSQLDLDGPNFTGDPNAFISAVDGDLVFDGQIADVVEAAITVGEGHFIEFTEGWMHGSAPLVPKHVLKLDGGPGGATIRALDTTFNGKVEVNGIGIIASPVTIKSPAILELHIGGVSPGSEHDQLQIEEDFQIDSFSKLGIHFMDGFTPSFQDRFVLITYPSHLGEFATIEGVDLNVGLEGGIKLLLEYSETDLSLVVGLDGGTPGEPNCNGQTISDQANIHGGIESAAEFHGFASVKEFKKAMKEFCEG